MIPKIDSFASSISAESDFDYTYDGYNYHFSTTGQYNTPNYTFNSLVIDYVIEKTADGLQIPAVYVLGVKVPINLFKPAEWIYSLYFNAFVALGKVQQDLLVSNAACYYWDFTCTGIDPDYPTSDVFGPAYGWRFTGLLDETIDVVLDQDGNFYGSGTPIGNYTSSEEVDEVAQWSIHQHDGDDIWIYTPNASNFNDYKQPYFQGDTLYLFFYDSNNVEHTLVCTNCSETLISVIPFVSNGVNKANIGFWSPYGTNHDYFWIDGIQTSYNFSSQRVTFSINGSNKSYKCWGVTVDLDGANIPSWEINHNSPSWPAANNTYFADYKGIYQGSHILGTTPSLWLVGVPTVPVTDPPNIPPDVPIPIGDIPEDPTDYDPEPDHDPDPVPGITYPGDEPQPEPVPPIPPIVSGNDDLWPDVNDLIAAEDSLGEYTFAIRNFEWPDFSNLMGDYLSPLIWVSTIISTLFYGSAYSIIFSVLSLMFVVAALLGILKGWTSRDG